MAFAFVVEDGTGHLDANSYVSVEDANDALYADIDNFPKWDALTDENKQRYLVWATRYLDERLRWRGERKIDALGRPISALRFPRWGLHDRDGVRLCSTSIPPQLQRAVAYMAVNRLINKPLPIGISTAGLKRFRLDPMEVELSDTYQEKAIPDDIRAMLGGLVSGHSFGKILRS